MSAISYESHFIPVEDEINWNNALSEIGAYDTYHLPNYQALMRTVDQGAPSLYLGRLGDLAAALPLTIRDTSSLPWGQSGLSDASSAYGYPGLISNPGAAISEPFRQAFQENLRQTLRDNNVVSMFTRMHPILSDAKLLGDLGNIVDSGETVAVDLTLPDDDQMRLTRKSHRYELRKSIRAGTIVRDDPMFDQLGTFVELYEQTMIRVNATDYYFFPDRYYADLRNLLAEHVKLFHAEIDGKIIGSALFFLSGNIIQYHLSATRTGYEALSPSRVILDHVRSWGTTNGYNWLHLGGGVGGQDDRLLRFKSGFSKQRFCYQTVQAVIDEAAYQGLCKSRSNWLTERNHPTGSDSYFPEYRKLHEPARI